MMASTRYLRLVNSIQQVPEMTRVQVHVLNEKNTDVNLASDLITGAWTGEYEQAVICTNDTDISGALSVIRKHHSKIILGLIAPIPGNDHRKIATDLINLTNWSKTLSPVHLANAQLLKKFRILQYKNLTTRLPGYF